MYIYVNRILKFWNFLSGEKNVLKNDVGSYLNMTFKTYKPQGLHNFQLAGFYRVSTSGN